MIYVNDKELPLLLEICASPEDCFLNHKFSKTMLKRLMSEGLIEVETRRISTWSVPQTNVPRPSVYGVWNPNSVWKDRTEIHACLTDNGIAWHTEYWLSKNWVQDGA